MDIIEKTKELGQMIADSAQCARYKVAETAQINDEEAQQLIKQYNEKRIQIARKMKTEKLSQEETDVLKQELQKEFDALLLNKNIKEYIDAKKEFDGLVQSVNNVLTYYITGEEPSSCSSGGCSSCSGCN